MVALILKFRLCGGLDDSLFASIILKFEADPVTTPVPKFAVKLRSLTVA